MSGTGPNRLAITQITTSFNTFSNTTPSTVFVNFSFYYRTSGTGTCANVEASQTTGFTLVSLRRFLLPEGETVDLTFATRPLLTPAVASGRQWCLIFGTVNPGTQYAVYVGVTGYLFSDDRRACEAGLTLGQDAGASDLDVATSTPVAGLPEHQAGRRGVLHCHADGLVEGDLFRRGPAGRSPARISPISA